MKKIKKILVPTDFHEPAANAFRYALWFADHYEASIELVHVVYPESAAMDLPAMAVQATQSRVDAAKEVMQAFVDNGLVKAQTGHPFRHVPVITSDVVVGGPTSVIADLAERDHIDLVIMGTHGEHGAFDKVFGSVASNTIHRVDCPVLVIPETVENEGISTIVFATDLDEAAPFHIWETCRLLEPFHPILRIVHIKGEPTENRPLEMKDLKEFFAERAPALQVTFHTFGAKDIVQEVNDFSEAWGGDLVIMHRPKRGFFERLFHHSVSREMALFSKLPLLVMR